MPEFMGKNITEECGAVAAVPIRDILHCFQICIGQVPCIIRSQECPADCIGGGHAATAARPAGQKPHQEPAAARNSQVCEIPFALTPRYFYPAAFEEKFYLRARTPNQRVGQAATVAKYDIYPLVGE